MKARHEAAKARIQEVSSADNAQAAQVDEARCDLAAEKENVAKALKEEMDAARAFQASRTKQKASVQRTEEMRLSLLEAQKKVAMIQVMQENHAAVERLRAERLAAMKAVQDFRKSIMEQRVLERKAIEEVTKKAGQDVPSHAPHGRKRKASEPAQGSAAEDGEGGAVAKQAK